MNRDLAVVSEIVRVCYPVRHGVLTSAPQRPGAHLMRRLLLVAVMGFSLGLSTLVPSPANAQQQEPITCASSRISPQVVEGWINPGSIVGTADGQIVFLVSDSDADVSTLFHVAPDNTLTEIGQMRDMMGVYGLPRWNVDIEAGNVVYTSYVEQDYAIPTTIMLMNLNSGERTTFMGGVNEYDFGRAGGHIWWSSKVVDDPSSDYGLYLYDAATQTTTVMTVPRPASDTWPYAAELIRVQPDGNVLFSVTRSIDDSDTIRTEYYRGDPQTGTSSLFHEELLDTITYSYPSATAILEDRAAYISEAGEYTETDFEGNLLQRTALLGPGHYFNLQPTPTGMLFFYTLSGENAVRGVYHVSKSGVLSDLTPPGESLLSVPSTIRVIAAPDGAASVWFNTRRGPSNDTGTLYVYRIPADDTIRINEPALAVDDVTDFYSSPMDTFVVAKVKEEAVLIDTATLTQTATGSDYDAKSVFFVDDQPHILDQGRVQFVDTAQGIVYFSPTFPPQDDYVLYAATYEGDDPVLVNLPDVQVPFSFHWNAFQWMPDGSVVYFEDELQSLFRAYCQKTG